MLERPFEREAEGGRMPMGKRAAAELLGRFWLVFGGCGSAVLSAAFPNVGIGLHGVSIAFGLTVLTMAYAMGHISEVARGARAGGLVLDGERQKRAST
jgi:hypothetical protein